MENLKCSEEEANALLEYDKQIDKGAKGLEFDLTPEQEKIAKKYRTVSEHKKPLVLEQKPRPRKENVTKSALIAEIAAFLNGKGYENVEILNKERQIALKVGENAYELTLVQKRKPKS